MKWLRRLFRREITVRLVHAPSTEDGTSMQLDMVSEWLADRARLLSDVDRWGSVELAICAEAIRSRAMLPGGIITCPGQPYPTNGGEVIG